MPRRKSSTTLCRKCLYGTKMGGCYACGYCLFTGKMRGCDPEDCTKFEKMDKKKREWLERDFRTVVKSRQSEYEHYISEKKRKGREV